jgi:transcriptional regulator with XRE-family HTH domain
MADLEREIEIFRAGKHTAANGMAVDISPADLQQVVDTYNPANFNAPVVLGHPKHNDPSWGQVKHLKMVGDRLKATVHKLAPEFVEWVRAGRYHAISPSFYLPDSGSNPYPGKLALRHIGFLGAVPPSVKGMAAPEFQEFVSFSDDEEGVVSFMCDGCSFGGSPIIANVLSRLRDFLISEYDIAIADSVINSFDLDALRSQPSYTDQLQMGLDELRKEVYLLQERTASSQPILNYQEGKPMSAALKKLMKQKGVTPAAAAEATGIDQAKIDAILAGTEDASDSDLTSIAEVLGVPKSMLGGAKKEPANMSEADTAELVRLKAENEALTAAAAAANLKARTAEIQSFCEGLVRDGRITAARLQPRSIDFGEGETHEMGMVDFMASLEPYQLEFYKADLRAGGRVIQFGEIARDEEPARSAGSLALPPDHQADPQSAELAARITSYAEEHDISFTEAYNQMSLTGALAQ